MNSCLLDGVVSTERTQYTMANFIQHQLQHQKQHWFEKRWATCVRACVCVCLLYGSKHNRMEHWLSTLLRLHAFAHALHIVILNVRSRCTVHTISIWFTFKMTCDFFAILNNNLFGDAVICVSRSLRFFLHFTPSILIVYAISEIHFVFEVPHHA